MPTIRARSLSQDSPASAERSRNGSEATCKTVPEEAALPSCEAFAELQRMRTAQNWKEPVGLEWHDIRFKLGEKEILKGISGMIEPGRLTGVLGPSGSGKTTLLNVLSGRQRTKGRETTSGLRQPIEFSGGIRLGGRRMRTRTVRRQVAYVFQDIALMETETPKECLNFSALLRLPSGNVHDKREAYVQQMLSCLRLENCANTCVGSAVRKGLSGGEQKRVAIGVELISNPRLLFLDEPLSGLDAYNAFVVTRSLKMLATSGVPVLMTLHQPSSEIFAELDDLLILHSGEVCFHGPCERLMQHFERQGFHFPMNFNPSDFVMFQLASSTTDKVDQIKTSWLESDLWGEMNSKMGTRDDPSDSSIGDEEEDEELDSESGSESDDLAEGMVKALRPSTSKHVAPRGFFETLAALVSRDFRGIMRQRAQLLVSQIVLLVVALLYGWFFFANGLKEDSPDWAPNCLRDSFSAARCSAHFAAHIAVASLISLNMMLVSLNLAIDILHRERSVLVREIASGYYTVVPFFISKSIFELCIGSIHSLVCLAGSYFLVGLRGNFVVLFLEVELMAISSSSLMYCLSASAPNREAAAGVAILPQVLQFAFSGLLVPTDLIPHSLQWLKYICPLYYGIGLVSTTEFGYVWEEMDQCNSTYGANWTEVCRGTKLKVDTLALHDVERHDYSRYVYTLILLALMYRSIAVLALWRKTRFAV